MKNKAIVHAHQQAEMYRRYYQPSFNLWRITKSILGVMIFGASTVPTHPSITRKRMLR